MMSLMKTSKWELTVFSMALIALVAGACGGVTATPTTAPTLTAIGPTFTAFPIPSVTVTPPATDTATPTSSLPISSAPDGLRMTYHFYGGLYLQDGSKLPQQLTQNEYDLEPKFSDDGKKIVFYRKTPASLYSINANGGREEAIVTTDLLIALNIGYDESTIPYEFTFVPGTHLLLFTTAQAAGGNGDLLIVDIDTDEIKSLLPPGQVSEHYISPDGRLLAINAIGRIDLFDINGEIIRRNLLTYTPSEPIYLPPDIHWIQDSSGLIVVLPLPTFFDTSGGAPNYTIWRYMLDGSPGIQVPLDPMPKDLVRVSPDGNWVTYHDERGALYIGDLRDGRTQLYEPRPGFSLYEWSPDSRYFVYGGVDLYLISIDASPSFIGRGNFIGWIDANRYLYSSDKTIVMGNIDGEKNNSNWRS